MNSGAAVVECIVRAFVEGDAAACSVLIIPATVGHNFAQMSAAAKEACPNAEIVGCTGSGAIGREGVSEAMRAMAVMTITGDEVAVAVADGLNGENSQNLGEQIAGEIKAKQDSVNMAYILTAGLNLSGDRIIDGIESVFGAELPIFGATAADNGKGARTFQFHNDQVLEEGLILVGFADPSLEVLSAVHHGSIPVEGATFEVTKSQDNRVIELDGRLGRPCWNAWAWTPWRPAHPKYYRSLAWA